MISDRAYAISTISMEIDKMEAELDRATRCANAALRNKRRLEASIVTLRAVMRELLTPEDH